MPYLVLVVYSGNLHRCSDWYLPPQLLSSRRTHAALKRCTTLSEWVTAAPCIAPLPEWQARQAVNSGQVEESPGTEGDVNNGRTVGRLDGQPCWSCFSDDGGRTEKPEGSGFRGAPHPDPQREMGRSWPREIPFPLWRRKAQTRSHFTLPV